MDVECEEWMWHVYVASYGICSVDVVCVKCIVDEGCRCGRVEVAGGVWMWHVWC